MVCHLTGENMLHFISSRRNASRGATMKGSPMWNKKLKTLAVLTAALAGMLASTSVTKANSIQISGVTTTLTAGVYDYAYSMSLTGNNGLSATNPNGNSLFVFYDVNGLTGSKASFTAGTTAVTDWQVVVEPFTSSWAGNLSSIVSQGGTNEANDLASIPNVRFQYVGADFSPTTTSAIGTAHLFSTGAPGLYGQYAARWIGLTGNTEVNSQSPLMPGSTSVPLPSAVWMGGSLLGLAFFARARRRISQ